MSGTSSSSSTASRADAAAGAGADGAAAPAAGTAAVSAAAPLVPSDKTQRHWGAGRLRGCALGALNGAVVGLHRALGGLRGAGGWSCNGGEARGDLGGGLCGADQPEDLGGGLCGADQPEDLGDLAEDEGHLRWFEARTADESVAHDSDVGQPAAQAGVGLENGPAVASVSGERVDLRQEVVQVELPGGFPVPC